MPLSSISVDDDAVAVAWSLSVPVHAAWAGLSDPAVLSLWLGQCIECDVRSDGRLVVDHGDGYVCRSVVTEADEPHRLAMTWEFPDEPESRIGIELRPSAAGTVVELAHHGLGDLVGPYGPGWITHLTFLEAALADVPIPAPQFWNLHTTFESLHAGRNSGSSPATVSR
ncbi:SRPBCC domain-containing protein [Janibacter cremeus]|uniref:Uncharacterized protein YndB with AHSA1/START domain n=1 Tax=Janibacter cremeus TaxID=1285192 RepID=A0A852VYL2_9MICO|nr:SRPBCC domain-containing protein [Janibacter cremeus]NYF98815.1 uncharacterized protein YndB with AHSA1/START domain [Janibacter cremeus]